MAVPASQSSKIPDSVSHLDIAVVAETLVKHAANVKSAAAELRVPASDLRQLTMVNQALIRAALEAEELRLDEAEANVLEALRSDDSRRRDAASYFIIKNSVRSKQRGWIPSSAASVDVALAADLPPRRIVVSWRNPSEDKPDKREASDDDGWETIERDGQAIRVPRYDGARRDDDIEGELSLPATMIEHAAAVGREPELVASSPMEALSVVPEPESASVRYQRERIDAWIRNRLIAWPLASCFGCRKPIVAGAAWEEVSNGDTNARARFHRTCHAEWRSEREAAARQALGLEG